MKGHAPAAVLFAMLLGSVGGSPLPVHAAPLSISVSGNHLVDGAGQPVRLLGADRSGAEYACVQWGGIFDGPSDDASVASIAAWKTNAVRVPLNEDCWLGINGEPINGLTAAAYQAAIVQYVQTLHNHGLYAILDLHWNAPGTQQAKGQQVMVDADHGPAFWSSVASAFKADPAVLFDLYNEPEFISWACLRDGTGCPVSWPVAGMQTLVNTVRATGATQPIMIGGVAYANDLSQWLQYEPADPQHALVASLHTYNFNTCNSVTCWNNQVAPVALQVPVVAGEIGEDDGQHGFIDSFMGWADTKGISYLAWTWDTWGCGNTPVLISDYSGTACQTFGSGYQAHLAQLGTVPPPPASPSVAFVRGVDNALWFRRFDGTAWGGWQSLGGVVTAEPHAVAWPGGRIDVFIRGQDHQLWQRTFDGTSWGAWNPLGGVLTSGATASSWSSGRIDVFARGTDGQLWHRPFSGTAWGAWEPLGGLLISDPGAVAWSSGRIDVFVRGVDNQLWRRSFDGTAWGAWQPLGGILTAGPGAASWATARLDIFIRGQDRQLWHRPFDGGAWGAWEPLGGVLISGPSALSLATGQIDVYGPGADRALWHRHYENGWSGWQSLGGTVVTGTDPLR